MSVDMRTTCHACKRRPPLEGFTTCERCIVVAMTSVTNRPGQVDEEGARERERLVKKGICPRCRVGRIPRSGRRNARRLCDDCGAKRMAGQRRRWGDRKTLDHTHTDNGGAP